MKRALLPIALFALLTYCLPLVSLLVPVLADGGQSAPAAEEAVGQPRRSAGDPRRPAMFHVIPPFLKDVSGGLREPKRTPEARRTWFISSGSSGSRCTPPWWGWSHGCPR